MKKFLLVCAVVAGFGGLSGADEVRAATTVTSHSVNSSSIGRYKKFEVTMQISRTFRADSFLPYYYYDAADTPATEPNRGSPYGVDGITINGVFRAPSGKTLTVPAFYYQDYIRGGGIGSSETMTPTTNYAWKIRFAPEETGNYTYYIEIADKDGSSRYPASGSLNMTAVNSDSKGFVRVSAVDSRFMAFSDGSSYIPIGSGRQWWQCCGKRSWDYEDTFNKFGANGINLTRIWDQNDGYGLTVEGRFDAYAYPDDYNPEDRGINIAALPKGTQMNQRGNYEEDKIIEAAERNGVYIQLCSHADPYWIWDSSYYDGEEFHSKKHVDYWKRNFRYRAARWGYSTSVLAWETWNEHGNLPIGSNAELFYRQLGDYQKQTDPFRHIRTTSQGSQVYSPAFWSQPAMDMGNYHDYLMSNRYSGQMYNDEVYFIYRLGWCLNAGVSCNWGDTSSWSGPRKPWVVGEFDVGTTVWNEVNPAVANGPRRVRMLHNATWAGLFSPIGTSPLDWYWSNEDASTINARLADRKAVSTFFRGVDYAGARFAFLMSQSIKPAAYTGDLISVSDTRLRALGMRREDKKAAYIWLNHADSIWSNSGTPTAVSANVTMGGLLNESYRVEIWNTTTGQISRTETMTPSSGNLSFNVTGVTTDIAVKVVSTNSPGPTSQPTATIGQERSGDANGDNKVDGLDYTIWLRNYDTQTSAGPRDGDFNRNGSVDGVDYTVWLKNYDL